MGRLLVEANSLNHSDYPNYEADEAREHTQQSEKHDETRVTYDAERKSNGEAAKKSYGSVFQSLVARFYRALVYVVLSRFVAMRRVIERILFHAYILPQK